MATLTTEDRQQLRRVFDRHLEVGLHHGAQLAVYVDGECVVNFAGGQTGPEGGPESGANGASSEVSSDGGTTTPETRHVLFSCTKPYAGVAVHQLVEAGELDYDDRVVEHWPDFADDGSAKADITVRQVLSHQAGIPHGPFDEQQEQWGDWDAVVQAMEDIDPVFEPGEQPAYHAVNYGWLVGELVRRASGQPVREYVAEHVFEPLGMDHTSIGLGPDEADDVATLSGFEPFDRCRDPEEGLEEPPSVYAAGFNSEAMRRAVIPAANGIGTARDMARFYACIANGGKLGGTRILTEETVEEALEVQAETESDGTLDRPNRYAMGFWKGGYPEDFFGTISHERQFGHAGLGSVFGWGDPEDDIGFAYVTNGIREESHEHVTRVNTMTDALRTLL